MKLWFSLAQVLNRTVIFPNFPRFLELRFVHLSIHSTINFLVIIWGQVTGSTGPAAEPRHSSLQQYCPAPTGGSQGNPRPERIYNPSSVFRVYLVFFQFDVPKKISKGRQQWGILIRCQQHLSWLLSWWRSSGSTWSCPQMFALLTLSLRLSLATFQKKLISATCR